MVMAEADSAPAPLVYVVVLNYNGGRVLGPCLESLARSAYPNFRTLLVDNGSRDGSAEEAAARFPDIETILNGQNHFFSKGNNIGIARALAQGADYVFVLNNDTTIEPGCLGRLVRFMEDRPGAGGCQPALCFMDRPDLVASAGCRVAISGKAWDACCGEPLAGLGSEPFEVLGVTGGAMFLRAETVRRVGMFCERFQMYFEDVDLSLRIREQGMTLHCVPDAVVLHELSATTKTLGSWRRSYFCERNSYQVVLRNFPPGKILKAYLRGVPATAVAAAYNCYRGNFVYSWYILKAMALGLGAFLVQFPRRCLESGQRTYAFWPRIDEERVYPPACRGSEAGGKD